MAENADVLIEVDLLDDQELNVIPLGPPGITPPNSAFNTVALASQVVTTNGPDLVIDRAFGEYVQLILNNDIYSIVVQNWPPPPYLGRIHLDIYNQDSYLIRTWPDGYTSPNGLVTQLTAKGNDFIVLTTIDGGANVKVSMVSPNYMPIH
jgi:hypothetical protein